MRARIRRQVPQFARTRLDVDRIVEEEVVEELISLDVVQRSDLGEHLCTAVGQRMRVHVREMLVVLRPDAVAAVVSLERQGLTFEQAVASVLEPSSKTVDFEQFRLRRGQGRRSTTSD